MFYLNEKIYEEEPLGEDFFYGYSLFETMYGRNRKIYFFEQHMKRLKKSAQLIGIEFGGDIEIKFEKFLKKHIELDEFMAKIQISKDNLYIKISPFEGRIAPEGIEVFFVEDYYQNEMGYIKSANYLGNILARRNMKGFEGIFCNRQGYVTEGTVSNLFFIKKGVLYTPSLELNILPGITRKIVIELAKKNGIKVQEGYFTKENLLEAEGMFFTNSLMKMGLLWVKNLENIPKLKTKEIHKLEKEYYKLLDTMI